jgi:hypothetical protein
MKPTFKAPKSTSKLLKPEHEKVLSKYAFKIILRHYTKGNGLIGETSVVSFGRGGSGGRGLHSFTVQLNLSRF